MKTDRPVLFSCRTFCVFCSSFRLGFTMSSPFDPATPLASLLASSIPSNAVFFFYFSFFFSAQRIASFSWVCSASSRRTKTSGNYFYLTAPSRNAPFFADQTDRVKVNN